MRKIDKLKNIEQANNKLEQGFILETKLVKENSGIKFDLYDSNTFNGFKSEFMDLMNKYLGMSYTDDAGTSNDNRMFIYNNLMNMVEKIYPATSMRMGSDNNEYYTNRPKEMGEFLKNNGISNFNLKSVR